MFTEEDFCGYGTSMCLKYAGYVDACRYSYIKITRVSDEIMENIQVYLMMIIWI